MKEIHKPGSFIHYWFSALVIAFLFALPAYGDIALTNNPVLSNSCTHLFSDTSSDYAIVIINKTERHFNVVDRLSRRDFELPRNQIVVYGVEKGEVSELMFANWGYLRINASGKKLDLAKSSLSDNFVVTGMSCLQEEGEGQAVVLMLHDK